MNSKKVQYEFGSFRDPSGFVFYVQDEVYRALDSNSFALIQQCDQDGVLGELINLGYLIPTAAIRQTDPLYLSLRENLPHETHFLSSKNSFYLKKGSSLIFSCEA
jgi:hypothetical protein